MQKDRITIEPYVSTIGGEVALTPERALQTLPQGPGSEGAAMAYGPYMEALSSFLASDRFSPLLEVLRLRLGHSVPIEEIRKVRLISEKHGAFYNVARVSVRMTHQTVSLAMNVAIGSEQQRILENELTLLEALHRRFGLPYLPRPYLQGEAIHVTGQSGRQPMKLFIGEWFDDFHELHLSMHPSSGLQVIRLWHRVGEEDIFLTPVQAASFYRQASFILTSYFDTQSFEQIYPWHNAAGDFILRLQDDGVDLRLITVRDYRSLVSPGAIPEALWIAALHFFLNMTIRLRLDRMDGTGELAWAHESCLEPVLAGFLDAWQLKAATLGSVPAAAELLDALRSFTGAELLDLAETAMEDGLMEEDERELLEARIQEHAGALHQILKGDHFSQT